MISIDVVTESNLWSKKIKKPNIFFNSLMQVFPKKYRFIKKKVSLTILLSNNKNIKKLNKNFRNLDLWNYYIKVNIILYTLLVTLNLKVQLRYCRSRNLKWSNIQVKSFITYVL